LIKNGPKALPVAHDGRLLVVTDGWYTIVVDVETLDIKWKRLIRDQDTTRGPAIRYSLGGKYLAMLKEEYDLKIICMLSSQTGEVLWRTDPKDRRSPRPMYSVLIDGEHAVGLEPHGGQGFHLVCRHAGTGKQLFKAAAVGYDSEPDVALIPVRYGHHVVARVRDRNDFELRCMDLKTGKTVRTVKLKGEEGFGIHGRVSATVQNGRAVLMSRNKLKY
jgi:hypothetical protein